MEESRINFETAQLANQKGFEFVVTWKYILGFKNNFERDKYLPKQSLLQKWLREVHKSDITVITDWKKGIRVYYVGLSFVNKSNEIDIWFSKDTNKNKIEYNTYEQALEIGLQQSLNLI